MTAKQYLQRAWYVNRRIQRIREQIEQMEALVYSGRRPKLTGLPRGARGDWTDVVDRLDEYRQRHLDDIAELMKAQREVEDAIAAVENDNERDLLSYRYLNHLSWEQIAAVMHLDLRWVYRLHGRALLRVEEWLRAEGKM